MHRDNHPRYSATDQGTIIELSVTDDKSIPPNYLWGSKCKLCPLLQSFVQPRVPLDCHFCCCCHTPPPSRNYLQLGRSRDMARVARFCTRVAEKWQNVHHFWTTRVQRQIGGWKVSRKVWAETGHLTQMHLSILVSKQLAPGLPPFLDNTRCILPMCKYHFPKCKLGDIASWQNIFRSITHEEEAFEESWYLFLTRYGPVGAIYSHQEAGESIIIARGHLQCVSKTAS